MENYHSFPLILFHLQEDQNCKKNHTSRAGSNLKTASFPLPSSFSTNPNPVAAGRQLRIFLSYQLFFFSSLFSSRGLPIRAPCASPLVVAVTIEDHHLSPAPNPPPPPHHHHHHHHAVAAPSCPPPRRDLILPSSCSCATADSCTS